MSANAIGVNTDAQEIAFHNHVREAGKHERKRMTDSLKLFGEYVDSDGQSSTSGSMAYVAYTRMIYARMGLNKEQAKARRNGLDFGRDLFSVEVLSYIQAAEGAVSRILIAGMEAGLTRKAIKERIRDAIDLLGKSYAMTSFGEAA